MMTCQQLTTVCIFMTTCQIVPGQLFSNIQRYAISSQYPQSLLINGILRRPPSGYHYETMQNVLNNYQKESYQIKRGLASITNRVSSSPLERGNKGFKKPKRKSKKKKLKPNDGDGDGDGDGDAGDDGGLPDDLSPSNSTPPAADDAPSDAPTADNKR